MQLQHMMQHTDGVLLTAREVVQHSPVGDGLVGQHACGPHVGGQAERAVEHLWRHVSRRALRPGPNPVETCRNGSNIQEVWLDHADIPAELLGPPQWPIVVLRGCGSAALVAANFVETIGEVDWISQDGGAPLHQKR